MRSQTLSKKGYKRTRRSLLEAYLSACKTHGHSTKILTDGDGRELSYKDISRAVFALSSPLRSQTKDHENIGILLPTGAGSVIALLAIHAADRNPAMLNFSAGLKNLKAAIKTAPLNYILTARKFIDVAGLSKLMDDLTKEVEIIYLEDLKDQVGTRGKIRALFGPIFPSFFLKHDAPDDPGVILFTSGTEGNPKGVVLSHANLLANIEQIEEHVKLEPTDIFFNPLPTFHCYGLTAGTLWPIFRGHPVVLHPSPLQTKTIAKRIFKTKSTVLFATDTFLQQYMRVSAEGGLNSLRLAVCGAERVREETRKIADEKFNFEVLEGYGVTECAPVLAANQPGDIRAGKIGKMLPGIETRIEPVEGLEEGGRLFVRGPNIMKGYIRPERPGEIQPLEDGWHDTGDIVSIDEDGYYAIRGRLKRFAKIGGEMVSLNVVENCAAALWPDHKHAAAILPDKKRGEQIILMSDHPNPDRGDLLRWAQTHGVPEISVPKKIISVPVLPILGTGKMDYQSVAKMAKDAVGV